jgi:tetratricopeptide (TPR) repeat protein
MHSYGVGDVERMLNLSRSTIRGLISRGFVAPARGPRREYLFSFQDLLVLRTARALVQAKVPARRIGRSLIALRRQLPKSVPLTGLTICAVGNDVVVRKGTNRWQAESGQYLLELDVNVAGDSLQIVEIDGRRDGARNAAAAASEPKNAPTDAQTWFERGLSEEETDVGQALQAYERCRQLDIRHVAARINLGRLLHESGRLAEAQRVYREALRECEPDPTLYFNLGVLLEDSERNDEAIEAYLQALTEDPDFADAHYNLARLYESGGKPQHAIRHLGEYRRLLKS